MINILQRNKVSRLPQCNRSFCRQLQTHKFDEHFLRPCAANYEPLSPLSFLERTTKIFGDRTAIIYDGIGLKQDYMTFSSRCKKLSSVLKKIYKVDYGDVVSIISPNTPPMLEAHFGVPGSGAVLHTINTRLSSNDIAFQLEHAESKVLFCDIEYLNVVNEALNMMNPEHQPKVVGVDDQSFAQRDTSNILPEIWYEDLLSLSDEDQNLDLPKNEIDAISLCYTSGTTGNPKGVVTHHRGAFLNALAWQQGWQMPMFPSFLWIVPLFHCNGWTLPWTIVGQAGVNVCQRNVDGNSMIEAIDLHNITHMAGAPVIMNILLSANEKLKKKVHDKKSNIQFLTAGAPSPLPVIKRMNDEIGIVVNTAYGLTEVYGPMSASSCAMNAQEKVLLQAQNICVSDLDVVDMNSRVPVPPDGKTVGEVVMKGNIVMKGYLKNERATIESFKDGFFKTGDLGVKYEDGQIEIKDRAKDIIISGGENIISVEVEAALYTHDAVAGAACIPIPDDFWGESVCAVVEIDAAYKEKPPTAEELINHVRSMIAHYKAPKKVLFRRIPRTVTGKIQKHALKRQIQEEVKVQSK